MELLPPRPQEQLLIDLLPALPHGSLITNTVGRGQFALAYASANRSATLWSLDHYHHCQIKTHLTRPPPGLQLICQSDFPTRPFDIAALLVDRQGDGELVRDLLQQACLRLQAGGLIVAATDNPRDTWLGEQLEKLYASLQRREFESGAVYHAVRISPPKKLKHYDAEFVCRDGDRLLKLHTRPGVFSHREVDPGARALLHSMRITPQMRVLDIGCGSGVVGLAAAAREPSSSVTAIDSNTRAVECAYLSAVANGLTNFVATVDSTGESLPDDRFDLALANPPYFANQRIAEHFVRVAARALRVNGELLIVTKTPDWYVANLPAIGFEEVKVEAYKRYWLVHSRLAAPL